jgi:FKBP-type peptidyl-prolyl cis-trans isomerase FkpA
MRVGGTRRIYVPSSLGYGAQGQGSIPPNAALVFEVELLGLTQ